MSSPERMKEVVETCLKTFMEKGVAHTSTRDLCDALDLNTGGIFWYFKTKDDVVIACAEEAAIRIETDLVGVALDKIDNPPLLVVTLHDRAIEMRPLMKFFVSVCCIEKYKDALRPVLAKLAERYQQYTEQFAERLCCEPAEIAPYVYTVINTLLSYMLFGQDGFTSPQLELAYEALVGFIARRDNAGKTA